MSVLERPLATLYPAREGARPMTAEDLWKLPRVGTPEPAADGRTFVVPVTRYDLALMGYGQGYAGQMTPFQMALAASAIANMEGKLMKPKIEFNQPPSAS